MSSLKQTPASCDEDFEEEFEDELEEEFEEEFEEEMEETVAEDEEYEDVEEELDEEDDDEEEDQSIPKVAELGEEGAKEEDLYEEEEEEEDEEVAEEEKVDKSFEKGEIVEELGKEEGLDEEVEEEEDEEDEEDEEEEEEEMAEEVIEKDEIVEELGKEEGLDEEEEQEEEDEEEEEEMVDEVMEKNEIVEGLGKEEELNEEEEDEEDDEEEDEEEDEEMVDEVLEKDEIVEGLGKEEELNEEEEDEEDEEEEEEMVDEVLKKDEIVEGLGKEDELNEEEEEDEEDEEEDEEEMVDEVMEKDEIVEELGKEEEEEGEEEEMVDEVFEKDEIVEGLGKEEEGAKEVGVDEKGVEEVKKEMVENGQVKKEEEIFRLVGEEKLVKLEEPSVASEVAAPPPQRIVSDLSLLQSISDLEKFHGALSKFLDQWKSINGSLDSISAAIDAHSRHRAPVMKLEKVDPMLKKVGCSEIQIICETGNGKSLRKYIEHNLHDVTRLRRDVTEALLAAKSPGKLVLQAIGRFYMQKRSCFKDELLVTYRRASILLLEFFVLSGRINEDTSLEKEADDAAVTWMNRIISEDIETATAVDSLGLVLFLACYGIPQEISLKDLSYVLQKSNLKKKGNVFRRSKILVEKIPGIIKTLIRDEMYVEAADLSCGFGLTDTFPPLPLLSSSALKAIEVSKEERQKWKDSPHFIRESDMRQLKVLKSIAKCIEDHKLGKQALGSPDIYRKIAQLESYLEKASTPPVQTLKRKAEHFEPYNSVPERRSKEQFRSSSETLEDKNERGYLAQPHLPDSRLDNFSIPHGWDRRNYENSAGYRSLRDEYSPAQNVYQPQAPAYANEGASSRRDLYKFADTVIERESQHRNSNRSSKPSSGASMFGRH